MKFQRIEDLRIDHDLTQNDIAKILSCPREVYRRYEKGSRQIPVDYLIKLANYYGCSTDYILGLTDRKTPYPKKRKAAMPAGSAPAAQQPFSAFCQFLIIAIIMLSFYALL